MAGFFESIFGGEKEFHKGGSSTEKFSDGEVVTRDRDGNVTERTNSEDRYPFPINPILSQSQDRVTRDGNGREINRQELKDRR